MNKKYDFLLAADSGGSKTDWICLTQDGTIVKKFTTPGMVQYFLLKMLNFVVKTLKSPLEKYASACIIKSVIRVCV